MLFASSHHKIVPTCAPQATSTLNLQKPLSFFDVILSSYHCYASHFGGLVSSVQRPQRPQRRLMRERGYYLNENLGNKRPGGDSKVMIPNASLESLNNKRRHPTSSTMRTHSED